MSSNPFAAIPARIGDRVLLYGPGGIGKTSLACLARAPIVFFDLESSLGVLCDQLPEDVAGQIRVVPGLLDQSPDEQWATIRDALHAPQWDGVKTIVIDSATKAEELCAEWVKAKVPHDKGNAIHRIEDYGYGKGYTHIYETFLQLLGDLDAHVRAGRNIILIAHDCTAEVPNPQGENYIRYEPRLQSPASGKNSVRLRVREWCDHVVFAGYDIDAQNGKARGTGTRTLYPVELPFAMAKSRRLNETMEFIKDDPSIWEALMGQQKGS